MAVRIRLSRYGRIHRPYFRIIAIDKRCHREGLANEVLGSYDPLAPDGKNIAVNVDRVKAWIDQGAVISEGLTSLFKHHGVAIPTKPVKAVAPAKATTTKSKAASPKRDGANKWVAPSRRAVRQHEAKLKKERMAKLATEQSAAAAAKAAKAASPEAATPTA